MRREERRRQFENLVNTVVTNANRKGERYRFDSEFENRARANRGIPRMPVESLIVQLALQDVIERVPTNLLTADDARNAARVAKLYIAASSQGPQAAIDDRIHGRSFG